MSSNLSQSQLSATAPAFQPSQSADSIYRERNLGALTQVQKKELLKNLVGVDVCAREPGAPNYIFAMTDMSLSLLYSSCGLLRRNLPRSQAEALPHERGAVIFKIDGNEMRYVRTLMLFLINTCKHHGSHAIGSIPCQTLRPHEWMLTFKAAYDLEIGLAIRRLHEQLDEDLARRDPVLRPRVGIERAVLAHDAARALGLETVRRKFEPHLFWLVRRGCSVGEFVLVDESAVDGRIKAFALERTAERMYMEGTAADDWDLQDLTAEQWERFRAAWRARVAHNVEWVAAEERWRGEGWGGR